MVVSIEADPLPGEPPGTRSILTQTLARSNWRRDQSGDDGNSDTMKATTTTTTATATENYSNTQRESSGAQQFLDEQQAP